MTIDGNLLTSAALCCGCHGLRRPADIFCDACFTRLPPRIQTQLYGLDHRRRAEARTLALEWFRSHPLQLGLGL